MRLLWKNRDIARPESPPSEEKLVRSYARQREEWQWIEERLAEHFKKQKKTDSENP